MGERTKKDDKILEILTRLSEPEVVRLGKLESKWEETSDPVYVARAIEITARYQFPLLSWCVEPAVEGVPLLLGKLESKWEETRDLDCVARAIEIITLYEFPLPAWCVQPAVEGNVMLLGELGEDEETAIRLGELEARWELTGDLNALAKTIELSTLHGLPLPMWCVGPAVEGIALLRDKGGRGKRKPATLTAKVEMDRMLCAMVEMARLDPETNIPGLIDVEDAIAKEAKRRGVSESRVRDAYYKYRDLWPFDQRR